MKQIFLLAAGVLLSLAVYGQNKNTDWNADLDSLAKELPKNHYNFFTVKSENDFLSGIDAIKRESKNLSDLQVALFSVTFLTTKSSFSQPKVMVGLSGVKLPCPSSINIPYLLASSI